MLDDNSKIIMDDTFTDGGSVLQSETQKVFRTLGIWAMLLTALGFFYILIMFTLFNVGIVRIENNALKTRNDKKINSNSRKSGNRKIFLAT